MFTSERPVVDAVVLCGGRPETFNGQPSIKGLLVIAGKPMVEHVLDALAASRHVNRRIVVVPPDTAEAPWMSEVDLVVRSADSAVGNLAGAIKAAGLDGNVLIVSADIPFVNAAAIDDFLSRCERLEADLYYPIIRKETAQGRFPDTKRTYMKLRDGTFTGGNIQLASTESVLRNQDAGERVFALRKSPIKLLGLLGSRFVLKFLTGRLAIADLERKAGDLLAVRVVAVESDFPEIGVDVDKPDDWVLAKRLLEQP